MGAIRSFLRVTIPLLDQVCSKLLSLAAHIDDPVFHLLALFGSCGSPDDNYY